MTLDVFRGRTFRGIAIRLPARRGGTPPPEGGIAPTDDAPDTSSCPACGRPLEALTGVCPGCGTRLLYGVQARRAGLFVGAGLVAGVLVGSLATGLLVGATRTQATTASEGDGIAGSSAAPAGEDGQPLPPAIPSLAASALRQSAAIDARLLGSLADLRATLAVSPYDPGTTAQALRDIAADATVAAQSMPALAAWPAAASVRADLVGFYDDLLATARAGLAYSISDAAAYRKAAAQMVLRFRRLPAIDAASRALAASAGIALAPVYPAPGATAAP